MSILSLFIFIVGVLTASSFVSSSSEEITLQDNLSSDLPGYYIWANLIPGQVNFQPDGFELEGIDNTVYNRARRAIQDFTRAVRTNQIEITAECFFSILVNWLVANDKELNGAHLKTHVTHQMNLNSTLPWGSPDLVIESSRQGSTQPIRATVVELKYFNRPWSDNWQNQLCSYMLGYYEKTGIEAHGVISNMVSTYHYRCELNLDDQECFCQITKPFLLFENSLGGYSTFDHDFFLHYYALFLKQLHMKSLTL